MSNAKLLQEWEVARKALDLDITAPFEVEVSEGIRVRADILLRNFGGSNGTLIVTDYSRVKPYQEALRALRYGWSVLEGSRGGYDPQAFVEMLSEWGWTGPVEEKPAWVLDLPEQSEE